MVDTALYYLHELNTVIIRVNYFQYEVETG